MDDMRLEESRRRVATLTPDRVAELYARLLLPVRQGGSSQLVGYVRSAPNSPPNVETLIHALAKSLPGTHIPRVLHVVDEFPRTSGGKVDVVELASRTQHDAVDEPQRPAQVTDPLRCWVQAVWSEVLDLTPQELNGGSNFFALGGTSLGGLAVSSRLARILADEVPVLWLLRANTLDQYVAEVRSAFGHRTDFERTCSTAAEVYGLGRNDD